MSINKVIYRFEKFFNTMELVAILVSLFMAFGFQFILNELPCPLCLLQRVGFLFMAYGLLLNLRFGLRPSHYAITLISALYTSFVALRQVALHIVPGSGVYGSAIFGIHLYTWSFIASMLVVVATCMMLGVDRQYQKPSPLNMRLPLLTNVLFGVLVFLIVANIGSVVMECGLAVCPDNPVGYVL